MPQRCGTYVPPSRQTVAQLTALHSQLHEDGDKSPSKPGQPLSVRSVRYLAGIVSEMLGYACTSRWSNANPAQDATVPTTRMAQLVSH